MNARHRLGVPLARPVTVAGERHDALNLRAPSRRDLREAARAGDRFARGIELAARMAGVPAVVILSLDDEDRERVGAVVEDIFNGAV